VSKFDRYMLSQLLVLFGFFSLVLVAVFWINRAVVLFDRLIGDGQNAIVFLEFTALGLPKLITTVLPLATFAAAVYVINRSNNESELTVMKATGSGPWRLAKPVFIFGLFVSMMMMVLSHILVPTAEAQLHQRETEISGNVTARLLSEGEFLNPAKGVTFYTREIGEDGVLRGVFLADRRDAAERVMYTAAQANLLREQGQTTLIMVDGLAQRLTTESQQLSTAKFQDVSFDISALISKKEHGLTSIRHLRSWAMISDWDEVETLTGAKKGVIAEEFHSRVAQSLFCIVAALVGFSTLILGGFSRFGVWREVVISFAILIFIDGMRGSFVDPVLQNASLWPMIYIPSGIGILLSVLMLWHASNPFWWRRKGLA